MTIKNTLRKLLFFLLLLVVGLTIYAYSFDNIEPVCKKRNDTEFYLLNYVSKRNLKEIVTLHCKDYQLKDSELKRVYLLYPILHLPDPIFKDELNYRENGCKDIDNMDIYCEVRFRKLENGKVDVWYNFFEEY